MRSIAHECLAESVAIARSAINSAARRSSEVREGDRSVLSRDPLDTFRTHLFAIFQVIIIILALLEYYRV